MTRWLVLVLVACSTRSVPDVAGVGIATPVAVETPPLTGAHGVVIDMLAITDEGDAVVSQDVNGGTRLWPALDGTREPIVVRIAMSNQLSVGRDDRGFVIASLDFGNGGELVHIATSGALLSHTSIAPEPPVESITVGEQGVLVVRADQTIAILDADGELRARLEAPAGSRIARIVTRHGHTLVVFSHPDADGQSMYGRWIEGTSWGAGTPDFQVDPQSIAALSPSGTRLLVDFERVPYLLDLQTGRILDNFGPGELVGFIDDETVATFVGTKLVWRQVNARFEGREEESIDSAGPFVAADRVVVSANQGSLLVHTKKSVLQLGYGIADVRGMEVVGDRVIVSGSGRVAMLLDAALVPQRKIELPYDGRLLADVRLIDDRFAIATYTLGSGMWWSVSVIELDEQITWQSMQHALRRGEIEYEPATGLLSITDSIASYLTPWDAKKKSFETWYRIAGTPADVHLLDPQATGGLVALAVRPVGSLIEIAEIHGADLKVGKPIEPRRTHRVPGVVVGVDRRGNVYAIDKTDYVVYHDGLEVSRIADVGNASVAPHPSGTYIALYGDQRIRLYDASGKLAWEIAAPLAQRIAWLGDDLIVDYAGGIGKIDAATGALIKRTCGWTFGLSALSTNDVLAGDSICDAQ
jgi:hypothetical protein